MPRMYSFEYSALLREQSRQLIDDERVKSAGPRGGLGFTSQSALIDDEAPGDTAAELEMATVIRENQELKDIEAALGRIADGSYGVCIDCGGEVGKTRLKAQPTAKSCLFCEEGDSLRVRPVVEDRAIDDDSGVIRNDDLFK